MSYNELLVSLRYGLIHDLKPWISVRHDGLDSISSISRLAYHDHALPKEFDIRDLSDIVLNKYQTKR